MGVGKSQFTEDELQDYQDLTYFTKREVLHSSQDGDCTFEDFLDMMSVFSDAAPKAVKAEHAFRIFDFDGDDMLGIGDLRQVVDRLTVPQRLNETNMQQVLQYILDEADLDDDGALSFAEFEHIIEKSSDFCKLYRVKDVEWRYGTYKRQFLFHPARNADLEIVHVIKGLIVFICYVVNKEHTKIVFIIRS
ncbi:calcium and integrin-binding protein 1 isoform X2 [Megachile rotundata]|uniref:calcium and integrin-binding protein 1 isoform X2 n=1 Tax=Megachile rotundata TaxID=143995 RepID=UPI000614A0F6|nr:PREDICTED: calcium and integrin-binding protein 1-like isoform X5 [Megachile rotundata]